ncbi:MAG: VWA domain-containing protein [Proteobacteria bacterium]|nr:MAG: VWA domain-containing protein [Pseudomonadota bacterium]
MKNDLKLTLLALSLSLPLAACGQKSGFKGSAKVGAVAQSEDAEPAPQIVSKEPRLVEESYTQEGSSGLADILIVVDDSGSMKPYQSNLSTKLNDLLASLKDTDWQIGVVTTSVKNASVGGADICDLKLIKSSDADREAKFLEAVSPGIKGSGDEQGMRQAKTGLACAEQKWIRDNSTVAVLIVTDEEDASYAPEWLLAKKSDKSAVQADAMAPLISYVENDLKRSIGVNAAFYGIFSPPSSPCKTSGAVIGNKYQALFDYKNSAATVNYGRVCDDSYKPTLELISSSISKLLTLYQKLKELPDAGSVVVKAKKADGSAVTSADYKIASNFIIFNKGSEPAYGSLVELSYKVSDK